jgi:quercetin dioxygenase-like cupin family protein
MEARRSCGNTFPYDDFMEREELPVHRAVVGVDDVTKLPRAPWARTGGAGTFIQLDGTFQSQRGIYVGEIPSGGQLRPEKHLYEEEIFVLEGQGVPEVWQDAGKKLTFEWSAGSVFAIPGNTMHCLYNGANRPAVYMGVTTAPEVMNSLKDIEFPFTCDYKFVDLYEAGDRYFSDPGVRVLAWPSALGPHPYQDGHGDKVLRVNWSRNSIYSRPNAYFHQHLNSAPGPAKHIAVYGAKLPMGVYAMEGDDGFVGYVSYREGGTLIEYEDEDPQVRRDFEQTIARKGVECAMPPVTYRQ